MPWENNPGGQQEGLPDFPEIIRKVAATYRFVNRKIDGLRPRERDLNEEREIQASWYTQNSDAIKEYFLGAMRIKRVIDSNYNTMQFKQSFLK